ncbi:hypothetical protein TTHERM_00355940 (macronuclear) [Tetrahymena thermophila SB210]|uniref:Uncharacterized protein n=1 Tax=Tetrahymena thermophila (strain SB210) TaxID=312017 RepID=Q22XX8_TETTS|nr:hypothetical protein TTHERM_00355940 [Tetrahymena thermophila SB210]EAR90246.3 hypothetical protein TTHERM_00355940 [Tetrahymena thermophila SB210]|eukprot:XP_001010491.3 hypothetical protein TTHERM_00355940 [Tetrahymena thermophila SB210]
MSKIQEFSFREFLYYLQVNEEFFDFMEYLDLQQSVKIEIKLLNNLNEINQTKLSNFKQWNHFGNNQLLRSTHFHKIYKKFKNYCQSIQQKYLIHKTYLIEDSQLTQDLLSIICIYADKLGKESKEAYSIVKKEINYFLQEKILFEVSITDIDLDNGIIYLEIYSENNNYVEKINQVIQDYVNQFEIVTVKPQSIYEPFIEQLSLKQKFAYVKILKFQEQKAIQDSKQIEKLEQQQQKEIDKDHDDLIRNSEQKQDNNDQSNKESDSQKYEDYDAIVLMRKRIQKEEVEEEKNKENITKELIYSQAEEGGKQQQKQLSLKEIGKLIEEENCDRFRQFDEYEIEILDKIIYLVNEFQFDQMIFNKYNVFIEIQEDLINIFGDIEGTNLIDQLVYQLKNNSCIVIKSINMPWSKIQQMKQDIVELNQEFQNEEKTQIILLDITLDVYSKLIVPIKDKENKNQDEENFKISYINFKNQHRDIFEDIFKEKSRRIEIDQDGLSNIQEEFLTKICKLDIKQSKSNGFIEFECTQRRFDKFSQSFNDAREGLMVKEDFVAHQIFFTIFSQKQQRKIIKMQSKYKFSIVLEALDDSNYNQICLICPKKKKEKIKQKIEKYLRDIKKEVSELNYELTEDDLEMFTQKGDYLMQEVFCSNEQEQSDQQDEEELLDRNLKNSQIYLQYYLSDIIYEFKNNLIDLQRLRSNQINKDFKIILSQNQINKYNESLNQQIIQRENVQVFQREISIQMISLQSYEIETKNILKGSASQNLIILDHSYEDHKLRLDEICCSKKDRLVGYIHKNETTKSNQIENKFLDLIQLKQNLSQIKDQQQVHIKIKEKEFNQDIANENSLVLIGQNLVDYFDNFANQNQFNQIRQEFFNDIFLNAILNQNNIHIMVNDKEIRSQLIYCLLYTLENSYVQSLKEEGLLVKIYFIKIDEDKQERDFLKKINSIQNLQEQPKQGRQNDVQKAEEEIQNTLQIFKNHEKAQSEKFLNQAIENAQWYYVKEKEGKSQHLQFDQTNCLIIDYFYRDFIRQRDVNQNESENKIYNFMFREDQNPTTNNQIKEREVRIDFQNEEVIIQFLNISINFNSFFKLYPQLEQLIQEMRNVFKSINNYNISDIILHATEESTKNKTIQGLIFEEGLYKIIFYKDKYWIESVTHPHFQKVKEKIQINRQALISDSNSCFGNEEYMHEKVHIKYNFKREDKKNQSEKYHLKLLVEKKDYDKAKKNLEIFFKFRRTTFEKAKQNQKEMSKKEKSLTFFYYTPKLRKFLLQIFKMNKYTIIKHQQEECFYIITSDSKTSIKNFEKNEISQLQNFYNENWFEILQEAQQKLNKKVIQLKNNSYFLNQLSSSHTQFLCLLKNWEIVGFKPYFFLIQSEKSISEFKKFLNLENSSDQIKFNIVSKQTLFKIVSKQTLYEYLESYKFDQQKKEGIQNDFLKEFKDLNFDPKQQDINILVLINIFVQKNIQEQIQNDKEKEKEKEKEIVLYEYYQIPLFYLLFQQ